MQSREKPQGGPDRKFMYSKQQAATLGTNGPGYRIITMKTGPNSVGVQVGQALRMQSGEYITILKKNGFSWNQDQSCWSGPHENLPTVKNLLLEELKKFDLARNYVDIPSFVNRYLAPMPREFLFKSKMVDCQAEALRIRYEDPTTFSLEHTPLDLRTRLYEFQKEGINFSIKNNGRVLIGDEMGVGKTIQALGVASVYFKEWPVLILCPSSLKYNWRRETLEWLKSLITEEDHIQVIWKGSEKLSTSAKVVICSYDLAKSKSLAGEIASKRFQVVICDEAHNLKSVTSERSRQLVPIIQRAKRVLMLTGTPAFARPVELYPILAAIRPDNFSSFDEFGNRYGEPQKNPWANKWEYKGSSCVPELHYVLKQIMIRRLKRDVLSELPAKHRQVVEIPGKKEVISQIKALTKKIEQQGKNLYSAV